MPATDTSAFVSPTRQWPLRAVLRRLVWLCMLPVVLLAAWLAYDSVTHQRESIEQAARHSVDDAALMLDVRMRPRMRALEMLAQSAAFDDPARWPEAHAQARDFQRVFGSHVILADAQGQMLFHTDRPYGPTARRCRRCRGRPAWRRRRERWPRAARRWATASSGRWPAFR